MLDFRFSPLLVDVGSSRYFFIRVVLDHARFVPRHLRAADGGGSSGKFFLSDITTTMATSPTTVSGLKHVVPLSIVSKDS